jgi:cytoskeleton protein RodZ
VKSEEFIEQDPQSGVNSTDIPEVSIGQRLKAARIALGLSQAEVAEELKLKVSIIRCLDEDDSATSLSPTFKNGYIRAYAKRVGVDSTLLVIGNKACASPEPLTAKMQSFSRKVERRNSDKRVNLVTLLIVSSSIISLVAWWSQQSNEAPDNSSYLKKLVEDNTLSANNSITTAVETEDGQTNNASVEVEIDKYSDVIEAPLSDNSTPAANPNTVVETSVTTKDGDEPSATDDVLVSVKLTFSDDCWMELTDAKGEPIAYGTKTAGRVVNVVGYPPFKLILGEPKAVAIEYAGQPFAMANYRPGKTAKITLPTL